MTVQANSGKPLTPFGEAVEADTRGRIALSHAIGIDPVTLWRWATGGSRPQSEAIKRQAARVLRRGVDELWPQHAPSSDHDTADSGALDRNAA
jgi:hypothetical protein